MSIEVRAQNTLSMTSVKAIKEATDQSAQLLAEMEDYAEQAGTTLTGIYQDAEDAKANANTARTSATTALVNLAQVQSVLEVVEWVATHGEYSKTTDTAINPNKTYYTVTATTVQSPTNDDIATYYELSNGEYIKTSDTAVVAGKTYYTVIGAPVANPEVASISTYYELNITEAMSNYIQSHLLLTNDGLYVMADNSEWKVLVKSNGVDILDANNNAVANYGPIARIGKTNQAHIEIDYNSLQLLGANAGDLYFIVKDTRNTQGDATIINKFIGNGWETDFTVWNSIEDIISITVDGTETSNYTINADRDIVTLDTAPAKGDEVLITFTTRSGNTKSLAFGVGIDTTTMGSLSTATGYYVEATGFASHAEGHMTGAYGQASHAEGNVCYAYGERSHAEGDTCIAYASASHAQNSNTIADQESQTAIGRFNGDTTNSSNEPYAFILGNGTSENTRSNALTVDWNGNVDIAGEYSINGTAIADFIVDQGTDGMWVYRKWNSGIAECWGRVSVASHTYNANGGYYNVTGAPPTGLFVSGSNPVLSATGGITGNVQTNIGFTFASNVNIQTYLINRNTSAVTNTAWVCWYLVGKWK